MLAAERILTAANIHLLFGQLHTWEVPCGNILRRQKKERDVTMK